MFVEVHDGKLIDTQVKELQRAIATGGYQLVLVDFRPREVVKGIIRIEANRA